MKSNPSPSAPLNLCAPVGVTGTTLPAHPKAFDLGIVQPSPVKDTPDFSGLAPIFDKAELASMKAAASPVESVGVQAPVMGKLDVRLLPWKVAPNGLDICGARLGEPIATFHADHFAPREARELAAFAVTACNSHAAKDAKIREADEIMKRCAMWLGKMIADGAHLNSTLPNDCVRTLERVEAFRAALALPCAPLGS